MAEWIKIEAEDLGFMDPRTEKKLESIEGRRNRPGVDEFVHLGKRLPDLSGVTILKEHGRGRHLMLLIEGAAPKEGVELDDTQALRELKETIGLPEGTALGADKRPIIPEEKENEKTTR